MGQERHDRSEGAMTGASGDVTPQEEDEEFIPGERRVIEDDRQQVAVTSAMHREADRHRSVRDAPGETEGGAPNRRDGGYGSEHGLSHDDPAYAMDEASAHRTIPPPSETGSDVKIDPETDRM